MSERAFSTKCSNCGQRAVTLADVPYSIQVDHDGRKYTVSFPALSVPRCNNCGNIVLDEEACQKISDAFRAEADLLTPEQIREKRESLGLSQQTFADLLGVAVSTLSRWENGAQVQPRVLNDYMRAFFDVPELRSYLNGLRRSAAASVPVSSHQTTNSLP